MIFKQLMDSFLIHYLGRFDKFPFNVEMHGDTYQIGEGEPEFTIQVNKDIPKTSRTSWSSPTASRSTRAHSRDCSRSRKRSATSSGRFRAIMTSATTSTSSGSTRH